MQQPIQISMDKTTAVVCEFCKSEQFQQIFYLRQVPALLSPTMKAEIFPVPAFQCVKCKKVAEMNQKKSPKIQ